MKKYQIVIVGGGAAGIATATSLKSRDAIKPFLPIVRGRIINIGSAKRRRHIIA